MKNGSSKNDGHLDNVRRVALSWLARRDYSRQEITKKLASKGYPVSDIKIVVANLIEAGLMNEQRLVENYIYWRRQKGFGPLRIDIELQARGLSSEMIAEQLQITDNIWLIEAHKVWQKHFKGKLPDDFKHKAKQIRFLQYRGFTREQIEKALLSCF